MLKRHILIPALAFTGLLITNSAMADGFSVHLLGGISLANMGSEQSVSIDPSFPQLAYELNTSNQETLSPLVGFGIAYQWDSLIKGIPQLSLNLGLTGYYLQNTLNGIDTPPPIFSENLRASTLTTVDYTINDESMALMLEPKLIYTASSWQPYVMTGIGVAANRLSNYSETPPLPDGAILTLPAPFQNQTSTNFAYEFGLGIQHILFKNREGSSLTLALEYHYMNWGSMELGPYPGQPTNDKPDFGDLKTNLFDLGLSWQF